MFRWALFILGAYWLFGKKEEPKQETNTAPPYDREAAARLAAEAAARRKFPPGGGSGSASASMSSSAKFAAASQQDLQATLYDLKMRKYDALQRGDEDGAAEIQRTMDTIFNKSIDSNNTTIAVAGWSFKG